MIIYFNKTPYKAFKFLFKEIPYNRIKIRNKYYTSYLFFSFNTKFITSFVRI